MIAHLDGDYETVDYQESRCCLIYDNSENEEYPIHWHNALEIIMPLTGGYDVICGTEENHKAYHIGELELLMIPPGTLHNLKASPGHRLILLLDSRVFADNPALTELAPLLAEPLLVTCAEDRELVNTLNESMEDIYILYSEFGAFAETRIFLHIISMLLRISESRRASAVLDEDLRTNKFRSIIKYIDSNYMNEIDLDDLAARAGYSKFHFSRIFKKYCGTTFITFLNRRRIRAAEALLTGGGQAVTSIAMQVGFSSLTTFNRVFKEQKGMTPSEFRRLYKPLD